MKVIGGSLLVPLLFACWRSVVIDAQNVDTVKEEYDFVYSFGGVQEM